MLVFSLEWAFCERLPSMPNLRWVVTKTSHHVAVTITADHNNRSAVFASLRVTFCFCSPVHTNWGVKRWRECCYFLLTASCVEQVLQVCRNDLPSLSICCFKRTLLYSQKQSVVQGRIKSNVYVRERASSFMQLWKQIEKLKVWSMNPSHCSRFSTCTHPPNKNSSPILDRVSAYFWFHRPSHRLTISLAKRHYQQLGLLWEGGGI